MLTSSLKSLVLSASIAVLVTFTNAAPAPRPPPVSHLDPCGNLGAKKPTEITYQDIGYCYRAVPLNSAYAAATFSTVHTLFNEFYIFKDSAMTPDLQAPFSSPPTDIIGKLETIGRTKYTSDYRFHDDIRKAINSLYDAHSSYNVDCYSQYYFLQSLALYAPVIDNVQTVRVFSDTAAGPQRQYEDCLVRTINDVDALTYLKTWADEELSISHDAGVRLNAALSSQYFDIKTRTFQNADSRFGVRAHLPPTATIKYEIQCGQAQPIALEEPWTVLPLVKGEFHDVKSFVENTCAPQTAPAGSSDGENTLRDVVYGRLLHMKEEPDHYKRYLAYKERLVAEAEAKARKDAAPAPHAPTPPQQQFAGADLLSTGNGTAFYHLKSQPDVGVLVFHTFDADTDYEVPNLIRGLKAFHARGVTKLVIDFQGNPGGYVNLAANTVNTFFPSNEFLATNLASDLRVTPVIQQLAAASFGLTDGIYDAAQYIDFDNNNQAYTDDSLFLQPVTYTRGGRTSQYTQRTTATDALAPTDPALATFAWTNNAANIRILTDGRCGSSCAIVAHHLTHVHKVEAYAIGGNHGNSLSMYSFAGGTVSDNKRINGFFEEVKLVSPLKPLPYASKIGLPILEIYAHGSAVPLEYDAAVYPSAYRMAYTNANSQDRLAMWGEVSSHAWST
ncbi:hypothetical protein EC957_009421 [Mortierella hygrophila]|uniref:Tail specific protease domain-containing protein n=1 Tax=Mortierella hygrophila TaxID=979708 RepID=A0A9P6EWB9_9FUNG|nr:hypothetical protein EC957_009421 [Mortierella hygrophila]